MPETHTAPAPLGGGGRLVEDKLPISPLDLGFDLIITALSTQGEVAEVELRAVK